MTLLAESQTIGNPVANIAIFVVFVLITLFVVIKAGRKNTSADEFFTGTVMPLKASGHAFGDEIDSRASGTSFIARTSVGPFEIWLPLLGPHQVRNALTGGNDGDRSTPN